MGGVIVLGHTASYCGNLGQHEITQCYQQIVVLIGLGVLLLLLLKQEMFEVGY